LAPVVLAGTELVMEQILAVVVAGVLALLQTA
jgi:hypothetical protein